MQRQRWKLPWANIPEGARRQARALAPLDRYRVACAQYDVTAFGCPALKLNTVTGDDFRSRWASNS